MNKIFSQYLTFNDLGKYKGSMSMLLSSFSFPQMNKFDQGMTIRMK